MDKILTRDGFGNRVIILKSAIIAVRENKLDADWTTIVTIQGEILTSEKYDDILQKLGWSENTGNYSLG